MNSISVNADRIYQIHLTNYWSKELTALLQGRDRVAIIVSQAYSPDLSTLKSLESDVHVFEVPDGEDAKNIETLNRVWNWLGAAGFTRSDLIVGIGGGAITDLAGFAASSW